MKKRSLWVYIVAVIIVLVIANWITFMAAGPARLAKVEIFSAGFLVGMTAMFIAVHFYRWK